jgi:hypothetical protein
MQEWRFDKFTIDFKLQDNWIDKFTIDFKLQDNW